MGGNTSASRRAGKGAAACLALSSGLAAVLLPVTAQADASSGLVVQGARHAITFDCSVSGGEAGTSGRFRWNATYAHHWSRMYVNPRKVGIAAHVTALPSGVADLDGTTKVAAQYELTVGGSPVVLSSEGTVDADSNQSIRLPRADGDVVADGRMAWTTVQGLRVTLTPPEGESTEIACAPVAGTPGQFLLLNELIENTMQCATPGIQPWSWVVNWAPRVVRKGSLTTLELVGGGQRLPAAITVPRGAKPAQVNVSTRIDGRPTRLTGTATWFPDSPGVLYPVVDLKLPASVAARVSSAGDAPSVEVLGLAASVPTAAGASLIDCAVLEQYPAPSFTLNASEQAKPSRISLLRVVNPRNRSVRFVVNADIGHRAAAGGVLKMRLRADGRLRTRTLTLDEAGSAVWRVRGLDAVGGHTARVTFVGDDYTQDATERVTWRMPRHATALKKVKVASSTAGRVKVSGRLASPTTSARGKVVVTVEHRGLVVSTKAVRTGKRGRFTTHVEARQGQVIRLESRKTARLAAAPIKRIVIR